MFHVQEQSWNFFQRCHEQRVERTSSVSSRSTSRPRSDVEEKIAASLNESRSVSDRSALLVAAETMNDKPDVAWSERTTAAVVASARLVRLSRGRGTAGAQDKESKFSILHRSRTVTSIIHTSEIYENSSTTCFSLYAFDGLVRRTLSQRRPCAARSTSSRFAAGPSGAERTWSTCSSFFFLLKLALRKRSRPPPPQTNVLRFASFCELLRRPLRQVPTLTWWSVQPRHVCRPTT